MVNGIHAVVYAKDAEKARGFFRDVLGLNSVDAGQGWLIFALPPAELGVHPSDEAKSGSHELYLLCADVHQTVKELQGKGVEFTSPVTDCGWGLLARFRVPGGGEMGVYQPKHATAISKNTGS